MPLTKQKIAQLRNYIGLTLGAIKINGLQVNMLIIMWAAILALSVRIAASSQALQQIGGSKANHGSKIAQITPR
jgi:hypothetical protein